MRHRYVAVNFIDIYFRTGRYPHPLPTAGQRRAVGVIEAVGRAWMPSAGRPRVGYLLGPQGAYCDVRVMPAEVLILPPDGVNDRSAATLMMKGMTAQYLFRQVFPLQGRRDHPVPRGGGRRRPGGLPVGARHRRHDDRHRSAPKPKAEAARGRLRAHHRHHRDDADDLARVIPQRVKESPAAAGVPVVYDSVGQDTLTASLDSLQVRGTLVKQRHRVRAGVDRHDAAGGERLAVGHAAGDGALRHAARCRCWPWPTNCSSTCWPAASSASRSRTALEEAAEAHRALESRRTTGATVLTV